MVSVTHEQQPILLILKRILISIVKFTLPLALGIFLIWYIYKDLTHEDKANILQSFKEANYFWVLLSIVIGILSHLSRAYRWKYLLEPIGYKPKFLNCFFSVMIGYLANFAFPRLGEVMRCGVMKKYEKIPLENSLGTVIAERAADFFILVILTIVVILFQIEVLKDFLFEATGHVSDKFTGNTLIIMVILLIIAIFVIYVIFKKSKQNTLLHKIKMAINGIYDGMLTIKTMKYRWYFIFHTLFIWMMYFLMFYLCFFSLEETKNVSISGALAAFVLGSYGIIAVQGGIGAYPAIITETLLLYQIPRAYGFAFGWIAWSAQAIMILIIGFLSIILMPMYNKNIKTRCQSASWRTNNTNLI
ncbi:MAG: lysylphosphatidylglycerol synthase transmembrane domain-containing protein [Bacteroidota bacterium]